jgi:spermidine synthase
MSPQTERPALAVAGLSAAIFLLEVLLTRIFSVTLFHHFAFVAISMGMLGLAVSAVRVSLAPERFSREAAARDILRAAVLFGVTTLAAILVLIQIGVYPTFTWGRVAKLAVVYLVCSVPFYFGGLGLSLAFTHYRERFGFLYGSDLAAAGLAGLAVFPLLRGLGGPSAVVATALVAVLAALGAYPHIGGGLRRGAWAVAATAVVLVLTDSSLGALRLRRPKEEAISQRVLYEGWNALSRVAVYDAPMWPWALAPSYHGPAAPGLWMDIDAAAATAIVSASAGRGNECLVWDLPAAGHAVAPRGRSLVIGSGGGRDVMAALLTGVGQVDAVEINPLIVDDVMRGRFRLFSGDLYDDPRVHVTTADGRTFVRRSSDRYDLIQLSLVDTWAATAAGAFSLSENNLYTLESVREYIQHLTPEGVLALTRWAGGETYRLAILVEAAARSLGIEEPSRHVAILQHRPTAEAENVAVALLFRRAPFDAASIERLESHVDAAGFVWLHHPLKPVPGRASEIARASDPLAEARRTEAYDVSPPTDDRPFFFNRALPFWRGLAERPERLFGEGRYLVAEVLALSGLLAAACIVLPLWRRSRAALGSSAAEALAAVPYFLCIGVGFMLVEMSLIQRFVLYLGHPTRAMTAVVFGLLVGAGLSSAWTGRRAAVVGRMRQVMSALVAVATLLVFGVVQPAVFAATQQIGFAAKLGLTIALVLGVGLALGTLMPTGIARLAAARPGLVPWAWGANGFASVVGASGAVLAAMSWGFAVTFRLGALLYLGAALAALLDRSRV